MAKKAAPQAFPGLTKETERTTMMAAQLSQLDAQNYTVDENYSHLRNNQNDNKFLYTNLSPKSGLAMVINKIRRFVSHNIASQLCKPIQFLRVNSRAAAIDEIKDIYSL